MIDINTYLQDYIESNNAKVQAYIPTFIELGIANINKQLRNTYVEAVSSSAILPSDWVAMRTVWLNDVKLKYGNDNADGSFNVIAGQIYTNPIVGEGDTLTYNYYAINQQVLTTYTPHLLIHAAAYEAYLFIGDTETASIEKGLFDALIGVADGWDTQGTLGLGSTGIATGGGNVPAPPVTPTMASGITLNPTGSVSATNVQDGIAELDSEKVSMTVLSNYLPLSGGTLSGQVKGITPVAVDDLTRKDYVDGKVAGFVDLTTNQTIAGIKTFSSNPISSATQSTAINALTRKDYVDGKVAGVTGFVDLTTNQTVAGIKTFTSKLAVTSSISANASEGTAGQVLQSGGAGQPAVWGVGSVGVGQTWQDVKASRAINTDYTNNTGKPIQVSIASGTNASTGSTVTLTINGVVVATSAVPISNGQASISGIIVPAGAVYRATILSYDTGKIWSELR